MGRRRSGEKVGLFPRIDLPTYAAPRVSVIIPAASTPELLGACLDSLARFGSRHIPFETIVVLNEASRDVEAGLRETVTGVEVVASNVNLGMAGSGNRGRSLARGEFLVTLHDDAEIEPGWLEALVETADAHPEAGAIGGKAILPDGRLQHAGFILWRDASVSPPWVGQAPAPTAFDRLRPVDFCGSSSLLVRATAWDAVGGLDERFYPAYYVDTDLCMALRQHRFIVLYQPASRIRHHQSASTTPRFREFVIQRNRQLFLEKWGAALGDQEPRDEKLAGGNRARPRTRRSFRGAMSPRGHRSDLSTPKASAVRSRRAGATSLRNEPCAAEGICRPPDKVARGGASGGLVAHLPTVPLLSCTVCYPPRDPWLHIGDRARNSAWFISLGCSSEVPNVRSWHKADMLNALTNVRFWGQSGH